jgi:hypothetical protein
MTPTWIWSTKVRSRCPLDRRAPDRGATWARLRREDALGLLRID